MTDDYRQSLDYLYGRLDYERLGMPRSAADLSLGRMRRLLVALGDPQDALRFVHVAGTKGKGSTAVMIASAAGAAGIRAGLFTSPHLHRLGERFRVDGIEATNADIVSLVEAVRPAVDRLDRDGERIPARAGATFFEITTAMGLLHFVRAGVGLVVLEVGMGGRLDSTNIVRPLVSVLTSISLDHTRLLGSTLAAITGEKAGIIKRGRPVVSGVRGDEPRAVVRAVASRRKSALRAIDDDFSCTYLPPPRPITRPTAGRARVTTWRTDWEEFDLPMLGAHQAENASIALATIDALGEQGVDIPPEAVRRGFASLRWPARAEVFEGRPPVVVDGAHNPASALALAATLRDCFPPGPRTLVFGTSREKDHPAQLAALVPEFDRIIATRYANNPRAQPPEDVADAVVALGRERPPIVPDPADALALAREITPADGLICVTGSLFLAAEIRDVLMGCGRPASYP